MEYELSEVTIGFNLVCLDHCLWRVRAGRDAAVSGERDVSRGDAPAAVSYPHLTLPTILRV